MELVYLWVEEYKNIKKQGFNFSPRFECEFDGDSLNIEEKEYTSIFPDNINITAIVGENGSGKSNILEMIFILHNTNHLYKYILFFKKNKKIKYYTTFNEKINFNIPKYSQELITKFDKHKINVKMISSLSERFHNKHLVTRVNQTNQHYYGNMSYEKSILDKSLKLFQRNDSIYLKDKRVDFKYLKLKISKIHIDEKTDEFTAKYFETLTEQSYPKSKYASTLKLPNLKDIFINNIIAALVNMSNYPNFNIQITNLLTESYNSINYEKLCSYINPENDSDIIGLINIYENLYLELKDLKSKVISQGSQELFYEFTFNIKEDQIKIVDLLKSFEHVIKRFNDQYIEFQLIDIDLVTSDNLSLENFSNGEKKLYSTIIDLKYELEIENNCYYLLFDEPDNYLHPNWSKEFINLILKNIPLEKNVHLVIATHSPFILSDIPKQNVIFLKKDKDSNTCANITNEIKLNPFGANIHTLLSDGFFMEDGLMGEFAKGKIEEIKKFYELVKKFEEKNYINKRTKLILRDIFLEYKTRFRHIQSIIGEPFLQTIIKNYLDELEILFNGKKEFLDKEIQRLQDLRAKHDD